MKSIHPKDLKRAMTAPSLTARRNIAEHNPVVNPLYEATRQKNGILFVQNVVIKIKSKYFNSSAKDADKVKISKFRAFKTEDTTLFSRSENKRESRDNI